MLFFSKWAIRLDFLAPGQVHVPSAFIPAYAGVLPIGVRVSWWFNSGPMVLKGLPCLRKVPNSRWAKGKRQLWKQSNYTKRILGKRNISVSTGKQVLSELWLWHIYLLLNTWKLGIISFRGEKIVCHGDASFHSLNRYLLSIYYVSNTASGINAEINKTGNTSLLTEGTLDTQVGERQWKQNETK